MNSVGPVHRYIQLSRYIKFKKPTTTFLCHRGVPYFIVSPYVIRHVSYVLLDIYAGNDTHHTPEHPSHTRTPITSPEPPMPNISCCYVLHVFTSSINNCTLVSRDLSLSTSNLRWVLILWSPMYDSLSIDRYRCNSYFDPRQ
jgi:hypothetical protein